MNTAMEARTNSKLIPLFAELAESPVKLTAFTDKLKIEGDYSDGIVLRIKKAKPDILEMLQGKQWATEGPWELSTVTIASQMEPGQSDLWVVARNEQECVFWYLGTDAN
jgi:hypothetical protein